MLKLGVNIDHVATIREARKTFEPNPVFAAIESEKAGADGIVCHLRQDRRHINDNDLVAIKKIVKTHLNLEMSLTAEIVNIALGVNPSQVTFVPENRQEITTEGGLDVARGFSIIKEVAGKFLKRGVKVSLFVDAEKSQIDASWDTGARMIELHTGKYAEAFNKGGDWQKELETLNNMILYACEKGFIVSAGHGLTYDNVKFVSKLKGLYELNIGHSIISKAVFVGICQAVKEMKKLIS
ncbi:pyridoxine 5'-phosphate synthase [Candidatus Omnitrophus magneticus]|uniref:Pyridoxine 5'-phosphate synthase n=1 Tax=Candidatus Omnitrophus magneticus TaxID=1609969 RepID=A0A0F0CPS8_9BACT|nr:pyridoxine 5'-phosphate synthase [Candidatus Omnitrophus magneticus]